MPDLVKGLDAVRNNIRTFNRELPTCEGLRNLFTSFRAYCVLFPRSERPLFGPVKFVGYQHMTAALYLLENRRSMSGQHAKRHVISLGMAENHYSSPWYDRLYPYLHTWFEQHADENKQLNRGTHFLLFQEDDYRNIPDNLGDAT